MKTHHGRNIKRLREFLGIKQEALAVEMGEEWNQKKVSLLEQKEWIEPEIMAKVAHIFQISEEALKSLDAQTILHTIDNFFESKNSTNTDRESLKYAQLSVSNVCGHEHLIATDVILKLYNERTALYREMLKENESIINWLKKLHT